MLLCSCFCLFLESSYPHLHMSKFYLYFKMQLKCHFIHTSFSDTPHMPRGGNPDKLKTPIRNESCSAYIGSYSHWHCVWHRTGVQWTQTELGFFFLSNLQNHSYNTYHFLFFFFLIVYLLYCVPPTKL